MDPARIKSSNLCQGSRGRAKTFRFPKSQPPESQARLIDHEALHAASCLRCLDFMLLYPPPDEVTGMRVRAFFMFEVFCGDGQSR